MIDFQTHPDRYRHWNLTIDGPIAYLDMDVDPDGGLDDGYELKLNSYDLGVDIELYDAVQRLRFEHPEVGAVVIESRRDQVFCAGANIGMLAGAEHPTKVNFCKFTNETRNGMEDASANSGQRYLAAINGTAAGGGYELALATDRIMLMDDGNAAVALPEVPLLAVLPGTGGLTRLVDKRHVRRDRADVFSTVEEGVKGAKALEWGLVDELVPRSEFRETVATRATEMADATDRPSDAVGVQLTELSRTFDNDGVEYTSMSIEFDRPLAELMIQGPNDLPPSAPDQITAEFWPLRLARELDDAILHLRVNELEAGIVLFKSEGDADLVAAHDAFLLEHASHWLVREIVLYWKHILKRIDMTSRTMITLVEPGSCFLGLLAEIVLASDRAYMLEGTWDEGDASTVLELTPSNTGPLPMANDLTRLEARFWGDDAGLEAATAVVGTRLDAQGTLAAGVVTEVMDDIDWDDELRIILEERSSFSPDALTAMEANLRFPGPETMETKIFGRLTAWQNWVFQRPNASGEAGALRRYGTGRRPEYDTRRV